jgi:uncharacterized protein GlcG (DUF336 family)
VQKQGSLILAVDGLKPDVGHEVLWVVRDCVSGEILFICIEGQAGQTLTVNTKFVSPFELCYTWASYPMWRISERRFSIEAVKKERFVSLTIDLARRILEASKQRAHELRSPVSIAIVDAGGHLVLAERMMAPYGWATIQISIAKATTAVMFNQSTDAVAQWGSQIPGFASSMAAMSEGKFVMAAGGWPIRLNGATIGGIGVSGGNASGRDDDIARAGLAVLEPARFAPQPAYAQVKPAGATMQQPAYAQVKPAGATMQQPASMPPPLLQPSPLPASPEHAPLGTVNLDMAEELNSQENPYGDGPASSDQYNESNGGH